MSEHDVTLTVDGTTREVTVEARTLLVHALRDELGYTGPKIGCESGTCGACTVHVDGEAIKACTLLAVQVDGAEVTTVEGVGDPDDLDPIQESFHEEHGLQCGYCTPGMVMTASELLAENPDPSREEIRAALKGNVCRCTGYHNVVDAIESAAGKLAAEGADADRTPGATPEPPAEED